MQLTAHDIDTSCARILCVGDELPHLLEIQEMLGDGHEYQVISSTEQADQVLSMASAFHLIITGERTIDTSFGKLLLRLRLHSPDAERLVFVKAGDDIAVMMAARDARVMRVLTRPCPAAVLREATNAALLRNRARRLRVALGHVVTPRSSIAMEQRIVGLGPR